MGDRACFVGCQSKLTDRKGSQGFIVTWEDIASSIRTMGAIRFAPTHGSKGSERSGYQYQDITFSADRGSYQLSDERCEIGGTASRRPAGSEESAPT